jgi:hypothetical protein
VRGEVMRRRAYKRNRSRDAFAPERVARRAE